jgi:sensor domain CHASE-containing protein
MVDKPAPPSIRRGLSLRHRVVIYIIAVVVLTILGETVIARTYLQWRFNELETGDVSRDLLRAGDALGREIGFISDSSADWGA